MAPSYDLRGRLGFIQDWGDAALDSFKRGDAAALKMAIEGLTDEVRRLSEMLEVLPSKP